MFSFKTPCAVLGLSALTALSISTASADVNVPAVQEQNGISFVSGGVGEEEKAALKALEHSYNLRITSTDKAGRFSGDTRIRVSDMQKHELVDVTAGPFFYFNMPKGRYVVEGLNNNQTKQQTVVIAGGKLVSIHFTWMPNAYDVNQ